MNFSDKARVYDNDRTIIVQNMMNLKVNRDFVFEEIIVKKLKYHAQVLYMHTYFFILATSLINLNLKTNLR